MPVAGPLRCPGRTHIPVLASAPIGWLWLLSAAATVLHCSAMGAWIPARKFQIVYPPAMVGLGAIALAVARLEGISLPEALVMQASVLIGGTIGMLPLRTTLQQTVADWKQGVTKEHHDIPRRHLAFFAFCLVVVSFAGAALTQ